MKKIIEFNDIDSISVFYKGMVIGYDRQKNVLFISEDIGNVIYKVPFKRNLLAIMEDKLFASDNDLYVYDEVLKEFVLYRESLGGGRVNIFNGNFIENKYERPDKFVRVTMYKGKSNIKLWEKSYFNRISWFCQDSYLYVTDLSFKYIDFIDAQSGEVINTLHFENPPISRFIYNYEDTLIVSLEIQPLEEYLLLGLDARTGQEKWSLESTHYSYIQDHVSGCLYGIGGKRFDIIAPNEGKVLYKGNMSDENKKFNVCPECGILGENGIYFKDNFPHSRIGLINIQTHKIEFVIDLNLPKGVKVTSMSYHNGRLYVKDTNDTLHIFAEE